MCKNMSLGNASSLNHRSQVMNSNCMLKVWKKNWKKPQTDPGELVYWLTTVLSDQSLGKVFYYQCCGYCLVLVFILLSPLYVCSNLSKPEGSFYIFPLFFLSFCHLCLLPIFDSLFLIWSAISQEELTSWTDQLLDRLQCFQRPNVAAAQQP